MYMYMSFYNNRSRMYSYGYDLSPYGGYPAVYAGDFCFNWAENETKWCSYGCCGPMGKDCCETNVALIVGLTVMSVLIVGGLITIICCCVRRRGSPGQIIRHNNPVMGPSSSIVTTTTSQTVSGAAGTQDLAYPLQGYYAPPPSYAATVVGAPPPEYYLGRVEPQAPPPYSQVVSQKAVDNQGFKETY